MEAYNYKFTAQVVPIAYVVHRWFVDGMIVYRTLFWNENKDRWVSDTTLPTSGTHAYFLFSEKDEIIELTLTLPPTNFSFKIGDTPFVPSVISFNPDPIGW